MAHPKIYKKNKFTFNSEQLIHFLAILLVKRRNAFPDGYFSDATWEIFIDLLVARNMKRRLYVSDIGLTTKVPLTTVIRHLTRLVDDGYVNRIDDPADRRKSYVTLSDKGSAALADIFDHSTSCLKKLTDRRSSFTGN